MIKDGFVETGDTAWHLTLTDVGREAYQGARRYPALLSPSDWRDEALTRITRKGEETTIEDARIPTKEVRPAQATDVGQLIGLAVLFTKMVARQFEISYEKAYRDINERKYMFCPGYKTKPHAATYNEGRNFCAACRKRKQRVKQSAKKNG